MTRVMTMFCVKNNIINYFLCALKPNGLINMKVGYYGLFITTCMVLLLIYEEQLRYLMSYRTGKFTHNTGARTPTILCLYPCLYLPLTPWSLSIFADVCLHDSDTCVCLYGYTSVYIMFVSLPLSVYLPAAASIWL